MKMETRNALKRRKDPVVTSSLESLSAKESDQNEDDSILESDDLAELRFSSQDNLLNSSQDGDNQCLVKWDYTSPQTVRQLKKMKGKYSVDDVKSVIAKFPDLPVAEPEPSLRNIRLMLPPKDAALAIERNKQLKAKQRELKKMQRRQRGREVAKDMIMFLQQEQHKQECSKADNLKTRTECADDSHSCCPKKPSIEDDLQFLEEEDDLWSDDDLFRDNSFLIEATQNPDKFINADNRVSALLPKNNLDLGKSSKFNPPVELSITPKYESTSMPSKTVSKSSVIPITNASVSSHGVGNKNIISIPTTSSSSSYALNRHTGGITQNKSNINQTEISYTLSRPQTSVNNCDKKVSSTSSFHTTNKAQTPSLKSPLRKSLSFDVVQMHRLGSKPKNKSSISNMHRQKSEQVINLKSEKQSSEMDLFDSSLSDDLLLQATLSQEMAFKSAQSGTSSMSSKRDFKDKTNFIGHDHLKTHLSSKPKAGMTKAKMNVKSDVGKDSIMDLLLSPVKAQTDIPWEQSRGASKSSAASSSRKDLTAGKSVIPTHLAMKHKPSQGLSASTPVKSYRSDKNCGNKNKANECSDSFLERAFEDSFMTDDALFESQILPMLEMAESQAQKTVFQSEVKSAVPPPDDNQSCSPIKCSPEEIEIKRQKALQKRSLHQKNDSQAQKTVFQSEVNSAVPPTDDNQSCSPIKCSPEEIEIKRQKALQKRSLHQKNDAQAQKTVFQSEVKSAFAPTNDNQNCSPIKCSQEEIEIKRRKALQKRSLRLAQINHRKS